MGGEIRGCTAARIVSGHEDAVIKALTFLRGTTISEVLYAWIKPFSDEAAEAAEVKKLLAIREQEGAPN